MPISDAKKYLALLLTDTTIQSVLWEVADGVSKVLSRSALYHYTDAENCVVKTDESLQDLGKESEQVSEMIFGLQPSWVSSDGLAEAKKPLLQKITKDLTLSPVGYIVVPEAILQSLASRSGQNNVILIDLQADQLHVALVQAGAIQKYESVGRSDQIALDITEAIARFQTANGYLPSHLLLHSQMLDDEELEAAYQKVLAHDWQSTTYFAQQPLIERLLSHQVVEAIVAGGASAIIGQPVATSMPTATSAHANVEPMAEYQDEITFGEERAVEMPVMTQSPLRTQNQEEPAEEVPMKRQNPFKKVLASPFWQMHKRAILGGAGAGLVALLLITVGGLWFFRSVAIAIQPATKIISKEVTITLDPDADASNPAELVLKAETVNEEVIGEQIVSTTGVKLVGDKSTGTVTILNKTDSTKSFDKGTTLSTGTKKFTLDEATTVASASTKPNSSGDGETREYGKAQVKVSAADIGAESNVTKGTEFKVSDFSTNTYSATAENDFSGGASREIRVVSKEDRDELLKLLTKTLVQQAEGKFKEKSGNGSFYAPTGSTKVVKTEWSGDIGKEQRELSLNLTLNVEALAYQSDDLQELAKVVLADEVPAGYELVDTKPELLSQATQKDDTLVLQANISAPAAAVIDQEQLLNSIVGQPLAQAQSTLVNQEAVQSAEIVMSPTPAKWLFGSVPRNRQQVRLILPDKE